MFCSLSSICFLVFLCCYVFILLSCFICSLLFYLLYLFYIFYLFLLFYLILFYLVFYSLFFALFFLFLSLLCSFTLFFALLFCYSVFRYLFFACHLRFIFSCSFACVRHPDFFAGIIFALFFICYICARNIIQIVHSLFMGILRFLRSSKPPRGWSLHIFRMVPKVVVSKKNFREKKIQVAYNLKEFVLALFPCVLRRFLVFGNNL